MATHTETPCGQCQRRKRKGKLFGRPNPLLLPISRSCELVWDLRWKKWIRNASKDPRLTRLSFFSKRPFHISSRQRPTWPTESKDIVIPYGWPGLCLEMKCTVVTWSRSLTIQFSLFPQIIILKDSKGGNMEGKIDG